MGNLNRLIDLFCMRVRMRTSDVIMFDERFQVSWKKAIKESHQVTLESYKGLSREAVVWQKGFAIQVLPFEVG